MKPLRAAVNFIKKLESTLLILILAVIVAATFFQVLGRFTPIPLKSVFEEAATFAFVWLIMIGGGACAREGTHMTMDFAVSFLPPAARKWSRLFGDLCGCAFGAGIIACAFILIPIIRRAGMVSAVMQLPIWIQNLSLAVGAALILFWSAVNVCRDVYSIVTGKEVQL